MDFPLHYTYLNNDQSRSILLLHGFMGSSRDWIDVITSWGEKYNYLAVDLPGHGKSIYLALYIPLLFSEE